MRYSIAAFFIFLISLSIASAQTEDPVIPEVDSEKFKPATEKNYRVRALLEFAGGNKKEGYILFPSEKLTVKCSSRKESIQEEISRISSVEFLKWGGNPVSKNSYRFNPVSLRIIYDDQSVYESGGNIPFLNEFSIERNGKKEKIYGYFFEYWKNGKWINLKSEDKNFPQKNPLPGTLTKITFRKDNRDFDLNKILPNLLRQTSPVK